MQKANWNYTGLWQVSCDHSSTCPSLNRAPAQAPPPLWHSSVLGECCCSWGECSVARDCQPRPRMASEWGKSSLYWRWQKQRIRRGPGLWLWPGPPQPLPRSRPSAHNGPACSTAQLHTRVRAAAAEGCAQLWSKKGAQTGKSIWTGQGQPLLALTEAAHHKQSQDLTVAEANSLHPDSLAPALLPSGVRVLVLGVGRARAHTLREWSQLGPNPQGFCSSTLGPAPAPSRVVLATEQRSSSSHLALALALPPPIPLPTKVMASSTPWGKMWLMLTWDLALPPKALGTFRLYKVTPTQGYPFKTTTGNCFT